MKLEEYISILGILGLVICATTTEGNILHDIKDIIKDIFSGDDDIGGDKKEVDRVRKTMTEWKSCLGVQLDKSELDHINEDCDDEFELTEEKDAKKKSRIQISACYRVCQLEHLGWLHDTDTEHTSGPYFNHTAVELFVTSTFPQSIQKSLKNKISNCARNVESFSDEKACKNYKPFFKCLDKAIHDKCKSVRGGKKGTSKPMTMTTVLAVTAVTTVSATEPTVEETTKKVESDGDTAGTDETAADDEE